MNPTAGIRHRMRRGAIVLALWAGTVALAVACGQSNPSPAPIPLASTSDGHVGLPSGLLSPEVGGATTPSRPDTWIGVRIAGDGYELVRWSRGRPTELAVLEGPNPVTDVTYSNRSGLALVALCCEPVSGYLRTFDVAGEEAAVPGQGYRVDVRTDGSLVASTDTAGILTVRPQYPGLDGQETFVQAMAADVSVASPTRVVALLDPKRTTTAQARPQGQWLLVLDRAGSPAWREYRFALGAEYCSAVALAAGRVGLLRAAAADWRAGVDTCIGTTLDILTLHSGQTHTAFTFPTTIRNLSADDSGGYLLATTIGGSLLWRTPAGEGGSLPGDGYVVADW